MANYTTIIYFYQIYRWFTASFRLLIDTAIKYGRSLWTDCHESQPQISIRKSQSISRCLGTFQEPKSDNQEQHGHIGSVDNIGQIVM
jgi:hypothetical protein